MGIFKKKKEDNVDSIEVVQEIQTQPETIKQEEPEKDFVFYIRDFYEVKQGGSMAIGQVLLGEVKEQAKVLYINQDSRVLGGGTVAYIEQAKVRTDIATEKGTPQYGSHYSIHLPEILKNEMVKGNLLVSSSMLFDDKLDQLNIQELVDSKAQESTLKLTVERKMQLGPIVYKKITEEDVKDLSIQEVVFLMSFSEKCRKQIPMVEYDENTKFIHDTVVSKMKAADKLFMTFDKSTGFPFVNSGFVDFYSIKEYAEEAIDFYAQQYHMLELREIEHGKYNDDMSIYAYLYFLGMENLLIDNGQYRMELKRSDFLPPPEFKPNVQKPVMNPTFRYALIDFFSELRWRVSYPEREANLKTKENKMIEELSKATYLVPMKYSGKTEMVNNQIVFKEDGKMMFAKITNNEDITFIPVFSDWIEFEKAYDKKEWNGAIITILDAITIGNGDGIAINPYGENLILNENNIAEVKKECERLNIKSKFQ